MTNKKGFTLVELMIVIAVIAILATISLFGVQAAQKSARDTQRQQIMNGIRASLERYNGDNSSYPNTGFTTMLNALTTGTYMSVPVDPGCTSGKVTYPTGASTADWVPCTGVTYSYTKGTNDYTLVLNKEGGGSAQTFNSPK